MRPDLRRTKARGRDKGALGVVPVSAVEGWAKPRERDTELLGDGSVTVGEPFARHVGVGRAAKACAR